MSSRPNIIDALTRQNALGRNALLFLALVGIMVIALAAAGHPRTLWLLLLFVPLLMIAIIDLTQTRHSLRRNYPVSARARWFFEWLRPFMRSYIVESDLDGRPFSHERSARSSMPFPPRPLGPP